MSEESSRRQSRAKQPRSYRFEDAYSFLDEEESASSRTHTPETNSLYKDGEDEEGDDFMPDVEEEPEDGFDEDITEISEESDDEYSGEERLFTPELKIVEIDSNHNPTPSKTAKKRKNIIAYGKGKAAVQFTVGGGTKPRAVGASRLRTRGVADFTKVGGQEARLKDLFGPRNEDLKPILLTRDHWANQETLPLREPGSMRRSFFENAEAREKEVRTTQEWFVGVGRTAFIKGQESRTMTREEAQVYMANPGPDSLNVLFGPVDAPQVCTLKKLSYVHVAEPFKDKMNRRGWIFNLSSRIQDAQWATSEDRTQYLAVAVEQQDISGRQSKSMENPKAPAFSATKPFPASIQIWAFDASENGELDNSKQPRLQVVICTDWGAPKQLRWCPICTNDESSVGETNDVHIGLLAGIWSDGRIRILCVSYPGFDMYATQTYYAHVASAAFDIGLPQTVPTNIHWLSGTTLAVATAAGTLAIWTISRPGTLSFPQAHPQSPKPWFYQQLADTYILTLSSGRPSQPHLISITTADGFARLYDIRTPNADTTGSIRGRTLCITQAWHEHTQSFVMPDEHYMLKHNPIRRFYHNLYSMRVESSITRCATSPVHPAMLVGGANGRVEASNPIGRIVNYKIIPWQQTWFAHEWRRPVDELVAEPPRDDVEMSERGSVREANSSVEVIEESATGGDAAVVNVTEDNATSSELVSDKGPHSILSQPLVRITEGYKAVQPGIAHSTTTKKSPNPEVAKGITIYEEQSAITALAWNPNLKYGTWAVAGMGSGLLRVEDVGV